jgi:hypothetical protein
MQILRDFRFNPLRTQGLTQAVQINSNYYPVTLKIIVTHQQQRLRDKNQRHPLLSALRKTINPQHSYR